MRNVAVFSVQHSAMLGHFALWQIVFRLCLWSREETAKKLEWEGNLTLSQEGFFAGGESGEG
jgi:hypothetical protein